MAAVEFPANAQTCADSSNPPSVWTAQYGNLRQNYNNKETLLTSSCLSNGTITLKQPTWSPLGVDHTGLPSGNVNPVYAQPLYLAQVPASVGLPNCPTIEACNLLIVATLNGSIFAFNGGDITSGGGTGAGNVIWSRTGQTVGGSTNYLWFDDCAGGTTPGPSTSWGKAGLPFAGIVSTPVIDTNASPHPVMYVTSLCQQSSLGQTQQWWIHQIDLYNGHDVATHQKIQGSATGSDSADDLSGGNIPFNAWEALQRSALLKVSVSGATPNPLIYVAFGFASGSEVSIPYHGWIFGYDSGLAQKFAFASTTRGEPGNSDTPSCTAACTECIFLSCPPTNCAPQTTYLNAANWCGHGGGVWMSGRGGAARTDSGGTSHAYFGIGNGGFQQTTSDGAIHNWGSSLVDFTQSSSGYLSSPAQYFTPNGNAVGGGRIPVTPPVSGTTYAYQSINQNDFDMSVSGVMLFDDASANHRALTFDKAGYGYLFNQGNLCGDTTHSPAQCFPIPPTGQAGFATGDLGNVFPFAGNITQCPDQETDDRSCDRITNLAFDPDSSPQRLYLWPSFEPLASLQATNNAAITPSGVHIGSHGTTVCGGSGAAFNQWVIPGDTVTDTQTGSADNGQSRIVTQVSSTGTQLTIDKAFSPDIGSCDSMCTCTSIPDTFSYNGWFVKPTYDTHPAGDKVQYPGGSVVVTSNNGSDAVVWGLANIGSVAPGTGVLAAYDAGTLGLLWCSNSTGCSSSTSVFLETTGSTNNASFAIPTIMNGYVYVPTSGITTVGSSSGATCSTSSPCSGILVYSGH